MEVKNISAENLKEMVHSDRKGLEIIDVREKYEFDEIHIEGSKSIPMSTIANRLNEIDWSKKVVFLCRSGNRSGYVSEMLAKMGKEVMNLAGGIQSLSLLGCDCLKKGI